MDPRREKQKGVSDLQQGVSAGQPHGGAAEITCQQFVELVTDYFEGALSSRSLTLVEEHLVMCDWCTTYADQVRATVTSLHELRAEPVSAEPSAAVLAALQKRKDRPE
jgi:predicted anti-sigma-YlaC factor YlaD